MKMHEFTAHKTGVSEEYGAMNVWMHTLGWTEESPIRDILDRQGHGHKTEPHYENLTENWCSKCMNGRIKSANREEVNYLFLVTRYLNNNHRMNGNLLAIGFLFRAEGKVWHK